MLTAKSEHQGPHPMGQPAPYRLLIRDLGAVWEISHFPYLRCVLWFVIDVLCLPVTFAKNHNHRF